MKFQMPTLARPSSFTLFTKHTTSSRLYMPRKLPTKIVLHPEDPVQQAKHAVELAQVYTTPDPGEKGPVDLEEYQDERENPRLNPELMKMLVDDLMLRKDVTTLTREKSYPEAIYHLKKGISMVVGSGFEVPLYAKEGGGQRSVKYMNLCVQEQILMMRYCNLIGNIMSLTNRDEEALNWFNEVEVIYNNAVWAKKKPVFDWIDVHYNLQEHTEQRFTAFKAASEIFWKLGNTSAVSHRLNKIEWLLRVMPQQLAHISQGLAHHVDTEKHSRVRLLRNPDPTLCAKLEIKNPDLQMLGSWQKVTLKSKTVLQARFHFASFVWKGRFYVLGGEKDWKGPFYRDFWCLDLEKMDTWRSLPECPFPDGEIPQYGIVSGWQMRVYKNRAYLFTGKKVVPYFDLATERWGSITTTWDDSAAYPRGMRMFHDYAMEIVDGKMYVFGGAHAACTLGCNLFMVLDIEQRTWRKLSGVPGPHFVADPLVPGPRRLTVSWLNKRTDRIWFLFGEAERIGAKMAQEEHGSSRPYAYDDLWTWDVQSEVWRRERFSGNTPCQRSEPAVLYHEQLDKVILFGGSNSTLPTLNPETHSLFEFTYFADTFVLDQSPAASRVTGPRWKHVLTRGFPTYRSQAKLFSDPATGKIYLFGGYTSVKFVPPREDPFAEDSRAFGDLWQLKLDLPGGHFDGVNLDEEARTARVGPWQRCYSCGSAGPWKKCGGTCRGKVFFCDNHCLKEGWKEHKKKHGCAKK